jgi:hypothetical protein
MLDSQDILLYGEVEDWRNSCYDHDSGTSLFESGKQFSIEGFMKGGRFEQGLRGLFSYQLKIYLL